MRRLDPDDRPRPSLGSRSSTLAATACGGPDAERSGTRPRSPTSGSTRAKASLPQRATSRTRRTAIDGALKAAPKDRDTRLLGARIALAKLDYTEAVKLTEGITGDASAKGLRGRAFWYAGDIEQGRRRARGDAPRSDREGQLGARTSRSSRAAVRAAIRSRSRAPSSPRSRCRRPAPRSSSRASSTASASSRSSRPRWASS